MVVTKRVIVGAVVACAVGGTGFLFAQSRSIDVETHGAVVRALGELDQRAAELSKEGLATRFGLVPNYDPLVGTVTTLEEDVAALDRALVRSDARTDAVVAAEAGLRAALDARRATVERLKREVAVLKNSLRYLPLAAEMLLRDTREAGDAEGGADAVNAVVAATLVYDLLGETRLLEAQKARVAALAAMRDAFPEDVREDLDLLIHHATRAASHHAVVGPLVDAMMGTELEAAVEGVRGAYDAAFADGVATATRWRTVLYVWCALLLVVVGVTLRKLRELFASLERKVAERTAALHARNEEMALVLDNVDQGLFTIDRAGVVGAERSAIVGAWLPEIAAQPTWGAALAAVAPERAPWFELAWEAALEDMMPVELVVEQLADRILVGGRHLALAYKPILDADGGWQRMLVIVTDVSADVAGAAAEERHALQLGAFLRLAHDRAGYQEFRAEAGQLVAALAGGEGGDDGVDARLLHTLKGNSAIYGVDAVAALANEIEVGMADERRGLTPDDRGRLAAAWASYEEAVAPIVGEEEDATLDVGPDEVARVVGMLRDDVARSAIAGALEAWQLEPTRRRLARLAEQAQRIGARLGKDALAVSVEDHDVRLDGASLVPVWQAAVHALRNAVDHGIETPEERVAVGKAAAGSITLATRLDGESLVIEVADDGRGVDWRRVAERGAALGLPHETEAELVEIMMASGVSTRDEATEISGRGVGMAALRDAVTALGGKVAIESTPGRGTTQRMVFPAAASRFRAASAAPVPPSELPRTRRSERVAHVH